jgi:hypothetical protein
MANAVLAFSYAKDDIVTIAGVFYAIAAYAAVRRAVVYARSGGLSGRSWFPRRLLSLAAAWAVRSSGVHHVVNEHAFRTRNRLGGVATRVAPSRSMALGPTAAASDRHAAERRTGQSDAEPQSGARVEVAMVRRLIAGCASLAVGLPGVVLALGTAVMMLGAVNDSPPWWRVDPVNMSEAAALRDQATSWR